MLPCHTFKILFVLYKIIYRHTGFSIKLTWSRTVLQIHDCLNVHICLLYTNVILTGMMEHCILMLYLAFDTVCFAVLYFLSTVDNCCYSIALC